MAKERPETKGDVVVTVESVVKFVFPEGLQHPLSTGRLVCYALYGPLKEGAMKSGRHGGHVVTRWELDAMCEEVEREDVLSVYAWPGRPTATMSAADRDAIIAQADARVKARRGRGLMPQLSRAEVEAILEDVPRVDGEESVRFSDLQRAVVDFRLRRVQRLKLVYPPALAPKHIPRDRKVQHKSGPVSSDVAPPEMFRKNAGLTDNGIASKTNRLLSVKASQLSAIQDANALDLTANVRLIRQDKPDFFLHGPFRALAKQTADPKSLTQARLALRHSS